MHRHQRGSLTVLFN